jgi:hypothetical protein
MGTHTTQPRGGRVYHYYMYKRRSRLGKTGSCRQKALRPAEVEPAVWHFVSELLTAPEKIKTGMERLIDDEVASDAAIPSKRRRLGRRRWRNALGSGESTNSNRPRAS